MLYETIVQEIPVELQVPMIRIVEAMEQHMREELAVRREDIVHIEVSVAGLAEAQHHSEQRLGRVETALADLAQAQVRTEQRVEELAQAQARTEQRVEELAQAQARTEQRIDRVEIALAELAQAQARTEQGLRELTQVVIGIEKRLQKVEIRLGKLVGDNLEEHYRKNAHAYLGRFLRNIKVVNSQELESALEEHLTDAELDDAALLDVRVQGRIRHHPDTPEILLAMEVSAVVDRADVERAQRRAALLRKAGLPAIATVAGEEITQGGEEIARASHVFVLQNGHRMNWEQAVASIIGEA